MIDFNQSSWIYHVIYMIRMLSTGLQEFSILLLVLLTWCVGCDRILVYDVVAQLSSSSILPDGKCLVRIMHQTLLMMHWKFSKVLDVGCILGIYNLRYLKNTLSTSLF
jgi:hypothetical protein